MKKEKELDIVFLLDRSGSMQGLEEDTIGGYNSFIKEQQNNNALVTTILFDGDIEFLTERQDVKKIKKLTSKEYYVRGCTALLDAIGQGISYLERKKAKDVIFVITTDGYENASREYDKKKIKQLIKKHDNWEFIYIGADIDSFAEGESIGIKSSNIANFEKSSKGVGKLFKSISKASDMMYMEEFDSSWKDELEEYIDDNIE